MWVPAGTGAGGGVGAESKHGQDHINRRERGACSVEAARQAAGALFDRGDAIRSLFDRSGGGGAPPPAYSSSTTAVAASAVGTAGTAQNTMYGLPAPARPTAAAAWAA